MTNCHICQALFAFFYFWGEKMKNRLKILRLERGLTQKELQEQTGIEQALLSKFEREERIPPTETLIRLADFYGVSLDWLLCRSETREKK